MFSKIYKNKFCIHFWGRQQMNLNVHLCKYWFQRETGNISEQILWIQNNHQVKNQLCSVHWVGPSVWNVNSPTNELNHICTVSAVKDLSSAFYQNGYTHEDIKCVVGVHRDVLKAILSSCTNMDENDLWLTASLHSCQQNLAHTSLVLYLNFPTHL